MFGLPGQTVSDWYRTLGQVIDLLPEHISAYELSVAKGIFQSLPDEDVKIEMYDLVIQMLTSAGYEHYEVSNFARAGKRSRHNQVYWRNEPYFGFGAGAAGYTDGVRSVNLRLPLEYIGAVLDGRSAVQSSEVVEEKTSMAETIMLALRTADGLDRRLFWERYGLDPVEFYKDRVQRLVDCGLAEVTREALRLSSRGIYVADEIAEEFLP